MKKIIPIKSGIEQIVKGRVADRYEMQAGIEISVPASMIESLKKKGYIAQSTKKEVKNNLKFKGE